MPHAPASSDACTYTVDGKYQHSACAGFSKRPLRNGLQTAVEDSPRRTVRVRDGRRGPTPVHTRYTARELVLTATRQEDDDARTVGHSLTRRTSLSRCLGALTSTDESAP